MRKVRGIEIGMDWVMALYSVDSGKYVDYIPHRAEYMRWRSRLTGGQLGRIRDELLGKIDADEIHTAGWMPGNKWTGTPWEPIYTDACDFDEVASGRCFGLFVWTVLMDHPETWGFGRYEKDGRPIQSMTYFRLRNPPRR